MMRDYFDRPSEILKDTGKRKKRKKKRGEKIRKKKKKKSFE